MSVDVNHDKKAHRIWKYFVAHITPVIALVISVTALYESNETEEALVQAQLNFEREIAVVAAAVEDFTTVVHLDEAVKTAMMDLKFTNYANFYDCFHKVTNFKQEAIARNKKRYSELRRLDALMNGRHLSDLFGMQRYMEILCVSKFNVALYQKAREGKYCPKLSELKFPVCEKYKQEKVGMSPFCAPNFKMDTFNAYDHEFDRWDDCIARKIDKTVFLKRQDIRKSSSQEKEK